jgi:hypothetical protein
MTQKGLLQDAASQYQCCLELELDSRAATVVEAELAQWKSNRLID